MNKPKVDEIMAQVKAEWEKVTAARLEEVRITLMESPHEDGNQRVTVKDDAGKDRTFLVPFVTLITKGLRGDQVIGKYTEITGKEK